MYYEDFAEAGQQRYTSRRRTVTETDAVVFTSMTGIMDPVFTDEIFAQEHLFGGRIVPGPLVMTYALGLTDEMGYGSVLAALGIDKARFSHPVRPLDTIQVSTEVVECRGSESRPETGIVTLAHEVTNQHGETVQTFQRTLLLRRRPTG